MLKKKRKSESFSPENKRREGLFWTLVNLDPVKFVSGSWDAFDGWRTSRSWFKMLWFLPAFLTFVSVSGLFLWGQLGSKSALLNQYDALAKEESPIESGSEDGESADSLEKINEDIAVSQYGDMLYKRMLQLEPNNNRAKYYVAVQRGAAGNNQEATRMMQELAPSDPQAKGFAPAHAWIAAQLLNAAQQQQKVDMDLLLHHLERGAKWNQINPILLFHYAGLLESRGAQRKAIEYLKVAASREPRFYLAVAEMCKRAGLTEQARNSAEAAVQNLSVRLDTDDEISVDRITVSQAHAFLGNIKEAETTLKQGIRNARSEQDKKLEDELIRALSNLYLREYEKSLRKLDGGPLRPNLPALDLAARVDPSNPRVGKYVALLANYQLKPTDDTLAALQKQLASGQAAPLTHMLLANTYLLRNKVEQAIQHWELALAQNPRLVLAMNNLAVEISKQTPPQIDRALELLDRADAIRPGDSELADSRGTVLWNAGRKQEAIAQFEKALQLNPDRLDTRKTLIEAYTAIGFNDEAEAAKQALTEAEARVKVKLEKTRGRIEKLKQQRAARQNG